MDLNLNPVPFKPVQLREGFAPATPPARLQVGEPMRSDSVEISAEARLLRRLEQAAGSNRGRLDQQVAIYRPGYEQALLQKEQSLKPAQLEGTAARDDRSTIARSEVVLSETTAEVREPEPDRLEVKAPGEFSAGSPAGEQTIHNFSSRAVQVAANLDTVNASQQIQAYAAAANLTQASLIVNYKV